MQTSSVNVTQSTTDWHFINWRNVNRTVRNLRQRIFRAATEGNLKKVRSLQKLMLRSYSNRLLSVRRVTQLNQGRRTAGIDQLLVKTPAARGQLVDQLYQYTPWTPKPAKRVYIPKANGKLRPLGIPSIIDRCIQAMVKNALEPYWESKFEAISYGFRPGRGCHDAIDKIFNIARPNKLKKWVVDADIKGAFDNISHEFLLKAIGNFPARELIKQWLKAGYVEDEVFHNTESGTPQGGIVSPLLANIALHGMEDVLGVRYKYDSTHKLWQTRSKRAVVRYADDFVVFCETKEDAQAVQETIEKWLEVRGLSLSTEKTKIVHLSEGFDFLGFNIRHYKKPTTKTGWKLLIKPSKASLQNIRDQLRNIWLNGKGCPVGGVIRRLNPIIRGQANYYRIAVSSQAFQSLDRWMYIRAIRFSKCAHPTKSTQWLHQKYWGRLNLDKSDRWVFGDKRSGVHLLKYTWFPVKRHILIKGKASPDDPTLRDYWHSRERQKSSELLPSLQKIAKHQNWKCRVCRESLFNGEEMHIHHKIPRSQGGQDTYKNLELVHLFCHQQIHCGEGGSS